MRFGWRCWGAVITAIVAAALLSSPAGAQTGGSLVLAPSSGPPDTQFTATAIGSPSCPGGFAVIWDAPSRVRTGPSASPTLTHFVPTYAGAGVHTVTASCVTGDTPPQTLTSTALFQVTPPPPATPPATLPPVDALPAPVSRTPAEALAPPTPAEPPIVAVAPTPVATAPLPVSTPPTAAVTGPPPAARDVKPAAAKSDGGLPTALVLAGLLALALAAGAFLLALRSRSRRPVPTPLVGTVAVTRPPRNLSQLADDLLGDEELPALAHAGPASRRITKACGGDDGVATPLIATLMWETVVADERFPALLADAGASDRALTEGRILVVRHGSETRHDLLVLDPGFDGAEPATKAVEVWIGASDSTLSPKALSWNGLLGADASDPWSSLDDATIRAAIEEAANMERFGLIVARSPEVLLTSTPSPAWPVGVHGARAPVATAGAVVPAAEDGSVGVITALHAVRDASSVSVLRRPGRITSKDEATDSCVIAVPDLAADDRGRGRAGPMRAITPRQFERAGFEGVGSGQATTTITGWDVDILARSATGSRVYTSADTVPGDSGAALIDAGDLIIGFAVDRSAFGESVEYSCWAWADQVFRAHGLQPLSTSLPVGELVG